MLRVGWIFATLLLPFVVTADPGPLLAEDAHSASKISVRAWSRATPPGASSGAIYGVFQNLGDVEQLASTIEFEGANHAMIHRTVSQDGMMRMRHARIEIPAMSSVELEPGGLHIMLMGLQKPLIRGCQYQFRIIWTNFEPSEHRFIAGSFGQSEYPALVSDVEENSCP
jgi:copper(I)-binding protein